MNFIFYISVLGYSFNCRSHPRHAGSRIIRSDITGKYSSTLLFFFIKIYFIRISRLKFAKF